jgi:hypothetical protein
MQAATDRQQEIADHILDALHGGGKSGGEIIEACRHKFSPSEVGPTLTILVRIGSVRFSDAYYYKAPNSKRRFQ